MNYLKNKIQNISYVNEKGRFLLFAFFIIFVLFVAFFFLRMAYARYEMRSQLVANIDKALYIFDSDEIRFNLDPDGIIPSNDPYVYRFSVANFNENNVSDVDLTYHVKVRTTTNLPITIQMFRNQLPSDAGAVNLLGGSQDVQDEDGAWYHVYDINADYQMLYTQQVTDYYTLVIHFPAIYGADMTYVNSIENIEVSLESKQMV